MAYLIIKDREKYETLAVVEDVDKRCAWPAMLAEVRKVVQPGEVVLTPFEKQRWPADARMLCSYVSLYRDGRSVVGVVYHWAVAGAPAAVPEAVEEPLLDDEPEAVPELAGDQLFFVYGTLRAGQPNHRLLADARLVGCGETVKPAAMYSAGAYPAVNLDEPVGPITGEVYECTEEIWRRLDRLEGYPIHYTRSRVAVRLLLEETGHTVEAWIYHQDDPHGSLIPSGDWLQTRWAVPLENSRPE